MKNQILKFFKIIILLFIILTGIKVPSYCYETVIINFPENEGWHLVYSNKTVNETIVQFMPKGETRDNWKRTVVFHSYPQMQERNISAQALQQRILQNVINKNNSFKYKGIKSEKDDTYGYWCVKKNSKMSSQCEILRTVQGYETVISMHYINKNISDLKDIERPWLNIMKDVANYYSYYRMDRMLNRATIFEF